MKLSWRDTVNTLLVILGALAVYGKLHTYSWWLIGSWKGAVATIGGLGLIMLLVSLSEVREEVTDLRNWINFGESVLWLAAVVLVVIGLFAASRAMFYTTAIVLGVIWLSSLARHWRHSMYHADMHTPHTPHMAAR
jgi:uncharacterized membrane protein